MISMIAAMDRNRVIGQDGELPWHLPADLKRFRRLTLGKPVIMGRRTFESIGSPLDERHNIILTRQTDYHVEGGRVAHSVEKALELTGISGEIMVIGGESIYRAFLPRADRLYLTVLHDTFEGDRYFPRLSDGEWTLVGVQDVEPDDENPWPHSFYRLERGPVTGEESPPDAGDSPPHPLPEFLVGVTETSPAT